MKKLLQKLQPGQLLKAEVLGQVKQDRVRLRLGALEVEAYTRLRLDRGQRLMLEVGKAGDIPQLRLLHELSGREIQARSLRQILPRQMPPAKLFETLGVLERAASADIKAALQTLASSLPAGGKVALQTLARAGSTPAQAREAIRILEPLTPAGGKAALQTLELALAGKTITPELREAMQNVLSRALPRESGTGPSHLRRALAESGLFLEARLASGGPVGPANDLKAGLFRLLFLLRAQLGHEPTQRDRLSTPQKPEASAPAADGGAPRLLGELLRLTEGGLARVQAHQLSALPAEESPGQIWQFELPIQQPGRVDSFLIRLEQEQGPKGDPADAAWRVHLNFDFAPLGPVAARLTLRGEEISSLFQAERPDSAALLERHLPRLNDAFVRAGLKVGRLHACQGVTEAPGPTPPAPAPLLDEKA